uniref:Cytochrome c biogenesis protein Ccs1 n=1 Tax=Sonderella linearis TaxID=110477 RepID=A0A1Z1MMG3_9FLOR|nr:cytochrome c biogenesis protein ccs1 [Sonderella linearis]ARW66964.1 cytochrome c biogenesis protein ccs1 [Sonderella linearis]
MKFFEQKNLLWRIFKKLSNLNFSISILSLIIIFSIIGSIIEQDQNILYYKTYYPLNNGNILSINWQLIYFLGLDHIFRNWWFIFILFIFIFSLISCTLSTQLPGLKSARRWKFVSSKSLEKLSHAVINQNHYNSNSFTNIIYSLLSTNFFVFSYKNSIYAYKGLYGRIAPIFVHISIIITLFGSMLGFLSGFVSQEMIPNGELFHLKNIINSGFYSNMPLDIYGRIDNFYITYYPDNSIKQFFSKISLFYNSKKVIYSQLISVNSPLNFHGITFYQTDWKINALRFDLGNGKYVQKKLIKTDINNKNCWLTSLNVNGSKKIYFILFNLNSDIIIFNDDGLIMDQVILGENFYLNKNIISIDSIITSTGLQIKIDPGIFYVYLGFFIIMLSTFLSYISYSQIWVCISLDIVNFVGSTNRAILFFEEDILRINRCYNFYTYKSSIDCNKIKVIDQILI